MSCDVCHDLGVVQPRAHRAPSPCRACRPREYRDWRNARIQPRAGAARREAILTDPDRIPCAALRRHVERAIYAPPAARTPASELAMRAGFVRRRDGKTSGDSTHLLRAVGIYPTPCRKNGKPYRIKRLTMSYADAVAITRALGLDPHEVSGV